MSGNKSCEPCIFHGSSKDAQYWCSNCEELLCKDCKKHHQSAKATRGHHVVTIEEFELMESHPFKVPSLCTTHNKKYDAYCISHEQPCCIICVTAMHSNCSGVVAFEDALKGFQPEVAYADLQERLDNLSLNTGNFLRNREKVLAELNRQKEAIEDTITEKRTALNEYFNKIEDRLKQELATKYEKCALEIHKYEKQIKLNQQKIDDIKADFKQAKTKKTELQLFLATRAIQTMSTEQERLTEETHERLVKYELSLTVDENLTNLLMTFPSFGKINVLETPCHLSVTVGEKRNPHVDVPWIFKPVQLKLRKSIPVKKGENGLYINSGIINEDGRVILADKYNNRLIIYKDNGKFEREVSLSCAPWDVSGIGNNKVAVSLPDSNMIEIVDTKQGNTVDKLKVSGQCSGIAFSDENFYISVAGEGIQVLDLKGKKLKALPVEVTRETFMTGNLKRLYYTHYTTHTVHCTTFEHEQVYKFNHDELNFPQALSVDEEGHVFVSGFISNTLLCISPDGQHRQVLLRQSDGLNSPTAVSFDQKRKVLLVCTNSASTVRLYDIVH